MEWFQSDISPKGSFPQYFKQVGEERVAVPAADVPADTKLLRAGIPAGQSGCGLHLTDDRRLEPAWPEGRAVQGHAHRRFRGDLFVVSLRRPALVPAIRLGRAKKAALQAFVEKIHASWPIDRDYMPPPSRGTLVTLDPALLVTPPKGLETGYVPIVTHQERRW